MLRKKKKIAIEDMDHDQLENFMWDGIMCLSHTTIEDRVAAHKILVSDIINSSGNLRNKIKKLLSDDQIDKATRKSMGVD